MESVWLSGHGVAAGSADIPWSQVATDGVIAIAYLSIGVSLLLLIYRRPDKRFIQVVVFFSGYILARGATHALDIWILWHPGAALTVVLKGATAVFAIGAAVAVWRLLPVLTKFPRVAELQAAVGALEVEIGKCRSAEEHSADIEEHLSLTLASIDAGLITTDQQGDVVAMNAVAERITGWRSDEARGCSYWQVLIAIDRPVYGDGLNMVQVVIDRGVSVQTPHRLTVESREGARTPIELNVALRHAEDGAIRGALVILKDMSRVGHAEKEVHRLASIVESSGDAIIGKTLEGRITSWNRGAVQLFGYTAEEAIGRSVRMLLPPERQNEEMEILANLVDGRVVRPFDTVRLRKDGTRVDISVSISPIRDSNGRVIGGSKIARDIRERLATHAALHDSEARLRFALEVAQVGNWDLDLESGSINRSIRHDRCFGYAELQPEWNIATFLRHVHPDEQDDVALSYRKALLRLEDWDASCRVVWPDGSLHWIRIQGSTRYDTADANRMLGIVSDITDQKAALEIRLLTQKLESENRQIQEANRLKSQFLANMSHELRSPLNAIIGFSDLLYAEHPPIPTDRQHQYVGHIRTSGRHLLQLINDVLDLSKVESGKFEFFPEPVDLSDVIHEVRSVLFTQVQRQRLKVDVVVEEAVRHVVTDPARLKQILYNYLSNAIKFSHENGLVTVRVRADRPGFFRLEVEDTGIGIAPVDLPRLFVEFQQLDASYTKRHQGTGLGLSLTRRMVEAQGGTVGVLSVLGSGSVFHVALPISQDELAAALVDPRARPAGGDPAQWLVVEDNLDDQSRIAAVLKDSGYRVDVASDLIQASSRADQKKYDALSLDLMSASPGGLDFLAKMRGDQRGGTSAVAALTLNARSGGTAAFSIADVLAKPLRADEIVHALQRFGLLNSQATVMVVDDDPAALALMKGTLERCGVSPILFLDGREALRELPSNPPTAIILDLMMPEFSGFEMLDVLSANEATRDIPVFIWTLMSLTDTDYDLLALSAAAILRKGGGGVESLLDKLKRWRPVVRQAKVSPE